MSCAKSRKKCSNIFLNSIYFPTICQRDIFVNGKETAILNIFC